MRTAKTKQVKQKVDRNGVAAKHYHTIVVSLGLPPARLVMHSMAGLGTALELTAHNCPRAKGGRRSYFATVADRMESHQVWSKGGLCLPKRAPLMTARETARHFGHPFWKGSGSKSDKPLTLHKEPMTLSVHGNPFPFVECYEKVLRLGSCNMRSFKKEIAPMGPGACLCLLAPTYITATKWPTHWQLKPGKLVVSRSQSAPHMHVLVCICSNVRQFHLLWPKPHNCYTTIVLMIIAMLHFCSVCFVLIAGPCFVYRKAIYMVQYSKAHS